VEEEDREEEDDDDDGDDNSLKLEVPVLCAFLQRMLWPVS
jgi:hypothetical protein